MTSGVPGPLGSMLRLTNRPASSIWDISAPRGQPEDAKIIMHHYYVFDISLLGVKPRIWRRFFIQKSKTFLDLHLAIQHACGWGDCHLFAFQETEDGPVIAGISDPEFSPDEPDAEAVKLKSYFDKKGSTRCFYQYDFGDDWWHEVELVDSVVEALSLTRRLMDGERAFPPEDCGGIPGYEDCVAALSGGTPAYGLDREAFLQWLGGWTPDGFELESAKKAFDF